MRVGGGGRGCGGAVVDGNRFSVEAGIVVSGGQIVEPKGECLGVEARLLDRRAQDRPRIGVRPAPVGHIPLEPWVGRRSHGLQFGHRQRRLARPRRRFDDAAELGYRRLTVPQPSSRHGEGVPIRRCRRGSDQPLQPVAFSRDVALHGRQPRPLLVDGCAEGCRPLGAGDRLVPHSIRPGAVARPPERRGVDRPDVRLEAVVPRRRRPSGQGRGSPLRRARREGAHPAGEGRLPHQRFGRGLFGGGAGVLRRAGGVARIGGSRAGAQERLRSQERVPGRGREERQGLFAPPFPPGGARLGQGGRRLDRRERRGGRLGWFEGRFRRARLGRGWRSATPATGQRRAPQGEDGRPEGRRHRRPAGDVAPGGHQADARSGMAARQRRLPRP
jgi:hypothetical protein